MDQLESIRADYFAEDVPITAEMQDWTEEDAMIFFDSGGTKTPGAAATVAPALQGLFALPPAKRINGSALPWSEVAGKPVLIMNVASR